MVCFRDRRHAKYIRFWFNNIVSLLIAKPVPFKFNLKVRDQARAQHVRQLFEEGLNKGEYKEGKGYWGENHGKNKELGWGKV